MFTQLVGLHAHIIILLIIIILISITIVIRVIRIRATGAVLRAEGGAERGRDLANNIIVWVIQS